MINKSNRTVKVIFDEKFKATAFGGLTLAERAASRTGLWNLMKQELPVRQRLSGYSFVPTFAATIHGLLAGGHGFSAAELIRDDVVASKALGLEGSIPEECSMHRVFCDAAGLAPRKQKDWYDQEKDRYEYKERGNGRSFVRGARRVGEKEEADAEMLAGFNRVMARWLPKLIGTTLKTDMRWGQWYVVFGDGSQTEVDGRCFEGAVKDHNGNISYQWLVNWLGPYLTAQELRSGSAYEPHGMPELLERTAGIADKAALETERMLALLDSAYFQNMVLTKLDELKWHYIIGANELRKPLERKAMKMPASVWTSGLHVNPKYIDISYCSFYYQPKEWAKKETIVALRYKKAGELIYRYQFLATNLSKEQVRADQKRLRRTRFEETIFAMYHHKQAHENGFKNPLEDMCLHNPPSGRFGANQVFYCVGALAVNLFVALSRSAMTKDQRGIRLRTMRSRYFQIAGTVAISARQTTVTLATALKPRNIANWKLAFERIQQW